MNVVQGTTYNCTMKVYINRKPVIGPYGGGNLFVKSFLKFMPDFGHEFPMSQGMNINPDVILIAGLQNVDEEQISAEQAIMYKMYVNPDCKLVVRVNENDARKGTNHVDNMLLTVSEHVDGTVFVSNWLRDYFMEKGWKCSDNTVIVNGVDANVFKPAPKLNNGKVNIVAHHWSDNPLKGADVYEKLDELVGQHPEKYTFTYIGRHRCSFKNTNVIRPLYGKYLGDELGKYDVYVSASRFDPGPNHIIEPISCGIPTFVHVDGGGCVEFAGENAVYRSFDELVRMIDAHHATQNFNTTKFNDWKTCIQEYNDYLEKVCQLKNP